MNFDLSSDVMANDEVADLLGKFENKALERGVLTEAVGVREFDFAIKVIKCRDRHFIAVDINSNDASFSDCNVKWAKVSSWAVEELSERGLFLLIDEIFDVDAYSERALCMSSGQMVEDWGYLDN